MKQIPLRNYYLFALWLPLIVPAIIFIIYRHDTNTGIATNILPIFFYASVIFGGVQYLGFILWATYRYHKSSAEELEEFFYKAPVQFIPICASGILIFFIVVDLLKYHSLTSLVFSISSNIVPAIMISALAVPYGYFYIALTHVLKFFLIEFYLIKE